ncbi:sensor histidine kinase [Thiosocius teredinicola]|uniref:sensor histidine kinase n=1 Tax=Thiosocius teredinicola TaxID=1973002 RepID=UPI0013DE2C85
MYWLRSRLSRKFMLGTSAGLLISSLVFLVMYLGLYRNELSNERADAAEQVNRLLQTSLENAMLKRDLDGLRTIISRLGQQQLVMQVFITNPTGEVRFANLPDMLGRSIPPPTDVSAPSTHFIADAEGRDVLRSINPVANRSACTACHGLPSQHPINGILYVDYDAVPIRHKAQRTTLLLMGSGALIVLINLAGGWWFIHRFITSPVAQLSRASQALAQGDLSARTTLKGQDELSELGTTFNNMAGELQDKVTELRHQGEFLQALVDAIPDGVRVIGDDYRVLLTNRAYRQQCGLVDEDGVGDLCYRITHQRSQPCPATLTTCPVAELRARNVPVKALHRHHDVDNSPLDVEIYAAAMTATIDTVPQTLVVESIRDLSKQIEYSQEQKLSELGKLATGIAHEIHNPLASVRLALDAMRENTGESEEDIREFKDYLKLVDREVDNCVNFTERLLRLGMPPSSEPDLVALKTIVDDTLSLVRWEAERLHIDLHTEVAPDLRVLGSDSELRMVVLNLIQNAFHAMPDGGELNVTARAIDDAIELAFVDSGTGIAPEQLRLIFDPFYSRRGDGSHGTGLGLPISRAIVDHHHGDIRVASELGCGSTFTVRLPNAASVPGESA